MPLLDPEYAQKIIVGVKLHKSFRWYVTEKEYWYLDIQKYERALLANGYDKDDATTGDYSDRFGIPILDENTADLFLFHIENLRVSSSVLSQKMVNKIEHAEVGDDLLDFIPCFFCRF